MASLMEELISTLTGEQEIYRKLLPIAEEKTKAIVENKLEVLQQITDKEQSFVDRIATLEKKREEVVGNIGVVLGRKPQELTLSELIRVTEKQPKDQAVLRELKDSIEQTVKRLAVLNERNEALIRQSLSMIEFNINLIQSTRTVPGNNYTRSAAETGYDASQTGMFDAKQ